MNKKVPSGISQKNIPELFNKLGISCNVYSSFEEIANMQSEWDKFVESVDGEIYMTYDWCRIWWDHYGTDRKLRIFIFRKDDILVGIIPIFKDTLNILLLKLQVAKIVGADFTLVLVNPPIQNNYYEALFLYANDYMINQDHCDAFYWGNLSGNNNFTQTIENQLTDNSLTYSLLKKTASESYTLFTLPESYDIYLSSLSKTTRKHFRQGYNALTKAYEIDFRLADDSYNEFNEFMKMHESQWKSVNKLGHFGDWPDAESFHLKLVNAHSRHDRLRLFCLYADSKPIVYRYIYRFGKRYHSFLPARISNPDLDKYGLGQIAHILTVEKAIQEGILEIDTGRGSYNHKIKLGGQEYPVVSYLICKDSIISRLLVQMVRSFSQLLELFYYRIWFNRLAPKLPFKRQPIWKILIRTRL